MKNQNKTISRQEFEDAEVLKVQANEDKDFYVVLDDLKIKNELRNLFFEKDLSKHTLHLKNPIYAEDLKINNIDLIDLKKLFK